MCPGEQTVRTFSRKGGYHGATNRLLAGGMPDAGAELRWAYYHQSGGHLFDQECRQAADLFLSVLEELTEKDPGIKETFYLELRSAAAEHLEKLQR